MNISFTKEELNVLWAEVCMVVDAAQECRDEGRPRADEGVLLNLKDKIGNAHTLSNLDSGSRRIVIACQGIQRKLRAAAGEKA